MTIHTHLPPMTIQKPAERLEHIDRRDVNSMAVAGRRMDHHTYRDGIGIWNLLLMRAVGGYLVGGGLF
eukprot:scaffold1160_cov120-Skeletonema_menzelii.AAC.13